MTNNMDTISTVISALMSEGYIHDFSFSAGQPITDTNLLRRYPDRFIIEKTYRFDDDTDPENEAIIYAVNSGELKVKGFIVNGYGIYSDPAIDQLISGLKVI